MTLEQKLEGVLFFKAAPMKKTALVKFFAVKAEALEEAALTLQNRLTAGATRLIITDTELSLVTTPELDELIESLRKDDLRRDIGKAGAETLAIIAYRGPMTRSDIDRIRGVNSSYILRNLLVRGLVEKIEAGRRPQFAASTALMAHLGVSQKSQLPEFTTIMNTLDAHERTLTEESES